MATEPQDTAMSATFSSGSGALHIEFCSPLWGFAGQTQYALRPAARDGIWWLHSTADGGPTFVLADPFVVDQNYIVDIGDKERVTLGLTTADDALTLVMLALPAAAGGVVTGNFRAPIVINIRSHMAMQVVSRHDAHEMQRPVNLGAYRLRDEASGEPG